MTDISKSFAKLCRSYVKLADKFQQLDVEYMTLKSKVVPVLKQLKSYQTTIEVLKQEKTDLKAELESVTAKYDELKVFEELLSPDMKALLDEASEQVDLVDETLFEMEQDDDPDLSEADKMMLQAFRENPDAFNLPEIESVLQNGNVNGYSGVGHYEPTFS
jgi:predicted nuclease with TOPRIM domain